MASAAARCSRLPQSSTEPRQPRNAPSTSTASSASGHHRFAYRDRVSAHAATGMALLLELLTQLKVQRLNKPNRIEHPPRSEMHVVARARVARHGAQASPRRGGKLAEVTISGNGGLRGTQRRECDHEAVSNVEAF